ncbi:hypothetical protein DFH07DRAFT_433564 [Mycena maculata]|uniref:Gelsolin n=1 Tax=Mycena maculata TaxID=230809 RepID=A0AAD7KAI1_9AGAR|nr:hypothetical protein DFH07DRAFT_433564 [Mycena maculata]
MDPNGSRACPPPGASDAGLSEWASKIKDMHRQVDPNEEADQKRLEDEIAASRLARLRRSRGLGSGSRTNSLDLSQNKYSSALRNEDTTSAEGPKSVADRQKSQSEALNKLMGSPSPPSAREQSVSANRPEPMSLAAFIGGRATGPRLNRHAPQQDAHDPTQFVQRTRIDAPHPIFGRGGIAMPGMVAKSSTPRGPDQPSATPGWSRPGRTPEPRNRRLSTPSPEKPESPLPISPQKVGVRERTMSTPTGLTTPKNGPIIAPQPTRNSLSTSENRPKSSTTLSSSSPAPSSSRAFTPRQPTSPSSPPLSKSPVVTPSLARPIQPDPRTSPHGPQISMSQSPSLAFLRPPPQKDPTPSLSRLQGRGFVQNMVKVSSQLDSPTSSPGQSEKIRPSGRKSSVLDRWPTAASPPPSPTAAPMRRSRTVEPTASVVPSSVIPGQITKSYSDTGKAQAEQPVAPTERIPGLGSATTIVIQPKGSDVDEHGFKRGSDPSPRPSNGPVFPEPTPTKPLIHPTKDRAKKPRKNKDQVHDSIQSSTARPMSATSVESAASVSSPAPRSARGSPPTPTPLPNDSSSMANRHAPPGLAPSNPTVSLKPTVASHSFVSSSASGGGSGMVGRRALPGMTQPHSRPALSPKPSYSSVSQSEAVPAPRALPGLATAASLGISQKEDVPPFALGGHSRIPSAGRPTAMDVAQALADPPRQLSPSPPPPPPAEDKSVESNGSPSPRPRNMMSPSTQAEKRKSSYERYSVILPPLKEETTPDPTPVSTLTRAVGNSFLQPDFDQVDWKLLHRSKDVGNNLEVTEPKAQDEILHFTLVDEPLPRVDVSPLVKAYTAPTPSQDSLTIQVDVMAIAGSTASPLGLTHIFYDTEILAIIHRSKSKSTGLISSTVWSWQGKNSRMGSSEERKVTELAKRYGTSIVSVPQLSEPVELVQCLGGALAVRQGSRAHWANENTAMHIVRSMHGVIFLEQVDIDIKNICSAFSYCVSILDTLFVWHGCGSTPAERKAATEYGRLLTPNPDDIVVLIENENDDDEMFWMVLGEEANYAKAHYWKWRSSTAFTPRIWSVDAIRKTPISPVYSFYEEESPQTSVYILDCVFEFFVLVPSGARGKRRDINLALSVSRDVATRLGSARPYTPTVHALILPSQIPIDIRIQFRDLEEVFLAGADVPDHMNILPFEEARDHLQTSSWSKSQVRDRHMLPLGLDESHVP